jgi:phenylacetate-coenzyme A ligase PaaK-like adenylate-forming protein
LVSKIPGYHGYKEKENRRAADKLLRDQLTKQLDEQRRRLAELQRNLLDGGGLLMVDDLDRAVTKVQKLADKIRTASYGYAGIFDAVKVKEEQLDALYTFDEGMLQQVASVQTAIDALATAIDSNGDVKSAIRAVVSAAEQAENTWRQRESAITGAV